METVEHMARNTGEHKDMSVRSGIYDNLEDLIGTILMINTNIFLLNLDELNGLSPGGARRQFANLKNHHQKSSPKIITKNYHQKVITKILAPKTDQVVQEAATLASKER